MPRTESSRRIQAKANQEQRSAPGSRETIEVHVGWNCTGENCTWKLHKPLAYHEAVEAFREHNISIHGGTSNVRMEKTMKHRPKA